MLGVAFDIGTTTIVGSSVLREEKKVIDSITVPNPQVKYGRDILSRITAIKEDKGLLDLLSKSTVRTLNDIIAALAGADEIVEITAAGNSVMEHILLNVSPEPIAAPPFKPVFKESKRIGAREAGLDVGRDTILYTFPLISGFVGGDAVAVILALGLRSTERITLAVDIGTNSEIMLRTPEGLFATSAAAGPAFEGGEISCGMTASRGAVQGLGIEDEEVSLDVIGGVAAQGICGSGLVDAAGELIRAGVIEPSGRIKNIDEVPGSLSNRIKEDDQGNAFVLFRGAKGEVTLTQSDIRALQVAKSAIRAGINLLLNRAGVRPAQVERVFIAGAFGSKLKKKGLESIGLLDSEWLERTEPVGDAALEGAKLALFSEDNKREAEKIARSVKFVSLSGSKHFEQEFIRNMNF